MCVCVCVCARALAAESSLGSNAQSTNSLATPDIFAPEGIPRGGFSTVGPDRDPSAPPSIHTRGQKRPRRSSLPAAVIADEASATPSIRFRSVSAGQVYEDSELVSDSKD